MSVPATFCFLIFVVLLVLLGWLLQTSKGLKVLISKHWLLIAGLVLVSLVMKYPLHSQFFYGLEYEDAYIFNASSRQLNYSANPGPHPFLTSSCSVGSLVDCQINGTYSGHLIGFPAVTSFAHRIFGFKPNSISFINLLASLLSTALVFLISQKLLSNTIFGLASVAVFSSTPVINVFHTSSLSETFSSTAILIFLLLYLEQLDQSERGGFRDAKLLILATVLAMFFAVLVKRENLLLLSLPLITIVIGRYKSNKLIGYLIRKQAPYLIASILIVLFYWFVIDLGETITAERGDVGGFPFQVRFLVPMISVFLKAYFNYEWFSVFTYTFFFGFALVIWDARKNVKLIYLPLFFLLYLSIYSLHYRGYFFLKTGDITPFDSLRYAVNFFPFYCLIAGYGIARILRSIQGVYHFKALPAFALGTLVLVGLFIQTQSVRSKLWEIELADRVAPVIETLKVVDSNSDILVTDEVLLFQIFGPDNLKLIDLIELGNDVSRQDMAQLLGSHDVYYLKKPFHEDQFMVERFPKAFELIGQLDKTSIALGEDGRFEIYRIENISYPQL